MTSSNEEKKGLEIVEENAFENSKEENEDMVQFYEENREVLESFGGVEIIGSIIDLSDEDFESLKSEMLSIFIDSLGEPTMERELREIISSENMTEESIKKEFDEK